MNLDDDAQHAALRAIAMDTLQESVRDDARREHLESLLPDIIADPDFNGELPEDQQNINGYIACMRRNGVYAGIPEFRALAEHYNVRIQICDLSPSGGFRRVQPVNETGPGADA